MKWNFRHRPNREFHWEAYYSPQGPEMAEIYAWCWQTFGNPVDTRRWDNHSGWIRFVHEADMTLFLLRWS